MPVNAFPSFRMHSTGGQRTLPMNHYVMSSSQVGKEDFSHMHPLFDILIPAWIVLFYCAKPSSMFHFFAATVYIREEIHFFSLSFVQWWYPFRCNVDPPRRSSINPPIVLIISSAILGCIYNNAIHTSTPSEQSSLASTNCLRTSMMWPTFVKRHAVQSIALRQQRIKTAVKNFIPTIRSRSTRSTTIYTLGPIKTGSNLRSVAYIKTCRCPPQKPRSRIHISQFCFQLKIRIFPAV